MLGLGNVYLYDRLEHNIYFLIEFYIVPLLVGSTTTLSWILYYNMIVYTYYLMRYRWVFIMNGAVSGNGVIEFSYSSWFVIWLCYIWTYLPFVCCVLSLIMWWNKCKCKQRQPAGPEWRIGNLNKVNEVLVNEVHLGGLGSIWLPQVERNMVFHVASTMLQPF